MNRPHRQLVIDGFLTLTAIALALVLALSKCTRTEEVDVPGELLLASVVDAAHRLSVRRGDGELRFVRSEGADSWLADPPESARGDPALIQRVWSSLRDIRVIRRVDDSSSELRRFGLESPEFVWGITSRNQAWTLSFGKQVPGPGGGIYVALSTPLRHVPQVYAVDADIEALDLLSSNHLEPALGLPRESDIFELRFESARTSFHVRRNQNTERWFEVERPGWRVDHEQVLKLLSSLTTLGSVRAPQSPKPVAEDDGLFGVLILSASAGETEIQFMGHCPGDVALTRMRTSRARTTESCADTSVVAQPLVRGLRRDMRLFTLRVDEVESFRMSIGGEVAELRRDGMGFTLDKQGTRLVTLEAGNDYLGQLLSAHGQAIAPDRLPPSAQFDVRQYVRLRSSVVGKDDDYEEKLLVGPSAVDGGRLVRRVDDDVVLKIDKPTADLFGTAQLFQTEVASPALGTARGQVQR